MFKQQKKEEEERRRRENVCKHILWLRNYLANKTNKQKIKLILKITIYQSPYGLFEMELS